jgi:hypothetical protein
VNLISRVLSTKEMTESHTAQNIAEDFKRVLEEYSLLVRNVTVTTDNAANITAAMNIIGLTNIRCMAHTLNLACQKALKISAIDRILGKVRRVVSFFRRSTTANNMLQKTMTQMSMQVLKPIIDVPTRWNSSFDMLERFVKIRPAMYITCTSNAQLRNQQDTLNDHELTIIDQLVQVS